MYTRICGGDQRVGAHVGWPSCPFWTTGASPEACTMRAGLTDVAHAVSDRPQLELLLGRCVA